MLPTSAGHPWAHSKIFLGNFYFYLPHNHKVRRPSIYVVTKARGRWKCSQLLGSFAFTQGNLPGYFRTIHKESHSWRMRAREVAWTQSGIRTERRGTRRHRELKTHWGGGAGLSATKLGVVRPWELITSSTPTSLRLFFFFFAPFLPTIQKKWTNSTLLGFSLLHSNNTNRCIADLPTGLGCRSRYRRVLFWGFRQSPLASGTEPRTGIAAKTPNRGFN